MGLALTPAPAEASRVVYVNTDPITIQGGMGNDPALDAFNTPNYTTTDLDGWVGATPEQIDQLLAHLKDTSVEFDIVFTLDRPADPPYDMVVFGSADDAMSAFASCSTQVGLSDCGDAGGVSVAFQFWGCLGPDDQLDPERVAFHTLGALGYGWGLENIAGTGQVMSGWSGTALKWGEACANINGGASCSHEGCAADQQNSSADLLANIGARVDDGPPVLTVLEPSPNADVEAPFDVVVEIDDAFGGITAELELVGVDVPPVVDDSFPYRWDALDLPAGPATLLVTAIDADGNEVSTEVPVCVGGADCPDEGGTDTGGETGGTEEGGESGGGDEVGDSGDPGVMDDEGGCSCSATPGPLAPLGGGLVLLALLGLRRRE